MTAAEIELKFRISDPSAFLHRAQAAGFRIATPRTLERNTLYDTPDRSLRARKQILRIRQYGASWVLTYKKPDTREPLDTRYKLRHETETQVAEGDALSTVFEELGYLPVFKYEKYRTELEDGQGKLVLDETPIGIFGEAEGEPQWIDDALVRLGIPQSSSFTESYGRLFELWQQEHRSTAQNMTFEEIGVPV